MKIHSRNRKVDREDDFAVGPSSDFGKSIASFDLIFPQPEESYKAISNFTVFSMSDMYSVLQNQMEKTFLLLFISQLIQNCNEGLIQ